MSHLPLINRLVIAVCGAWVLVAGARADNASSGAGQAFALNVTVKRGEIMGTDQIQRAFISSGTNQFLIVVPGDARVNNPALDRVTFIPTDYHYYLSFRVISAPDAAPDTLTSDYFRGLLLSRYPGGKIIEESSEGIAGHSGPSFSLQWTNNGGEDELVHVAFIPCSAGVLEFSLITDPKKSAEGQSNFRGMLMNFRSNENGKLQVAVFPEVG